MTHQTRLSTLALFFLLTPAALAQDATFDIEAEDPAVEATLTEKEEALRDFFEARERDMIDRPEPGLSDLSTRDAANLLDRADREATEFNDIDDDDLAELDRPRALGEAPRLEKPGQVEKDFPVVCPLGTVAGVNGGCVGE